MPLPLSRPDTPDTCPHAPTAQDKCPQPQHARQMSNRASTTDKCPKSPERRNTSRSGDQVFCSREQNGPAERGRTPETNVRRDFTTDKCPKPAFSRTQEHYLACWTTRQTNVRGRSATDTCPKPAPPGRPGQ